MEPVNINDKAQAKSREALDKALVAIVTTAAGLQVSLAAHIINISKHAEKFGDAVPALKLYEELPPSQRRKAIAAWFGTFTKIRILDGKKGVRVKLDKDGVWDISTGEKNPFYNLDEAKVGRAQGNIDALSILNKKLESHEQKIAEWLECTDENAKLKIFKVGVDPEADREALKADIAALEKARKGKKAA